MIKLKKYVTKNETSEVKIIIEWSANNCTLYCTSIDGTVVNRAFTISD